MTTPKDGTTKKRKGVKAKTLTKWANISEVFLHNSDYLCLYDSYADAKKAGRGFLAQPRIVVRVTIHLPATGIIKKARKSAPIDRSKFDCDND